MDEDIITIGELVQSKHEVPASQAERVAAWNARVEARQRAQAEALEEFRRTVFLPLWEQAEQQIALLRSPLFVTDWLPPSRAQRLLDARYAASASAQTLDEAQARAAIARWVQVYTDVYHEFEIVLESRRCKVCGSPSACPHDQPAPGGAAEMLYPATPSRLRRPQD